MDTSVCKIIREAEEYYTSGNVKIGKYVDRQMYEVISTIEAYISSKHINGLYDSLGREKPFFNIVKAARNIWYRATDLDRRHIRFVPTSSDNVAIALIADVFLQRWMDKTNFGKFLNDWGRTLATYGSAIVKFIERDGELIPSVVPWARFIPDPIQFDAIPRIEKFYMTPAQIRKNENYDEETVENLIKTASTRKDLEGQTKDNTDNFIEIYEVHGELSLATYKEAKGLEVLEGDDKIFKQQMHVVSFVSGDEGDYQDFTLYCGYEKQDPYMITHLIEEDGQTLSIGAVEDLFDAQWMQNHTIYQWKNQLDLASKLIFQTSDTNFVGRNVLTAIENGDIMIHKLNEPLTQINNQGHDSSSLQAFGNVWRLLSQEITSTPDAMRGNTQPSGTAYRSVAIQQQEASSLFELMTENKGIALEEMLRTFVIPHLKKQLDTDEEIMSALDDAKLSEIDALYIPNKAIKNFNDDLKDQILKGLPNGIPSPFMGDMAMEGVRQSMKSQGNRRSFKPTVMKDGVEVDVSWKEVFSDFEWDNVKVEITNESKDKRAVMETLTNLFQSLAQIDPTKANMVLGRIMTESGVMSPMEFKTSMPSPIMNVAEQSRQINQNV